MSSRRLARLLTALPFAAALAAPGLTPSPAAAAAAPSQAWRQGIGSGALPTAGIGQPYSSPAVGDLRGDGQREIVTGGLDGVVRAFTSGGQQLWANQTGGAIQSSPTLADLRGNGRLEVIVTSRNGFVNVYNPDGSGYGAQWPQRATFVRPFSNTDFVPDFFASAAVGSLFGDGTLDVVATSQDHRIYVWDANGNMLPGFPINLWDTIFDTPVLVDLEGRGQRDIVVGSDSNGGVEPNPAGGVWWAFRPDGSLIWKRLQDEVPWSSPSAAILNPGDVQASIVAGTGHYFHQTSNGGAGDYVNVFNANGSNRFGGGALGTPAPNFASPALGDVLNRGDGSRQIVQVSEDTGIRAWDGNGTLLWQTLANGNQLGSPIIAPLGGGACGGGNGVWVPGTHLQGFCAGQNAPAVDISTPGPSYGAPTVADLGNGQLSLVALYENDTSNTSWSLGVWPLSGTTTMPAGAWPTFHGSAQRTGTPAIVPDARNQSFVKDLYHDVLGRPAAPAQPEIDYWVGRLQNGAFRTWVASALVGSSEAHGHVVDGDYARMLGRTPDAGGRAYWVAQLDAGAYNEHLLGLLGGSDEYFATRGHGDYTTLVRTLYYDVLHRDSNNPSSIPAQDVGYWVNRLNQGMSRAVIGDVFANSHEYHLQLVNGWYVRYLFRNADGPGNEFWATFLDSGRRDDVTIVQLAASAEYFGHASFF
jgi:hypothetical protein